MKGIIINCVLVTLAALLKGHFYLFKVHRIQLVIGFKVLFKNEIKIRY